MNNLEKHSMKRKIVMKKKRKIVMKKKMMLLKINFLVKVSDAKYM